MLKLNQIYQVEERAYSPAFGDSLEMMKQIEDDSVDSIITDPPYGLGLAEWDIPIDIDTFIKESKRILKPNGFLSVFGQMPTMVDWINMANKYFKYKEHIIWVKRIVTPAKRLQKGHEEIFIYSLGNSHFYKTT